MTEFATRNLSVLSYAQGFTSWHYRHRGPIAEVLGNNFFDPAKDMIDTGDMIMVSASDGGAHLFVRASDKVNSAVIVVPMARTP